MLDLRHAAEGPARDGLRQYFLQSPYELQEEHYVDDSVTLAVFPWHEMRRALAEVREERGYPQRTVLDGSQEQDFLGVDLQQSATSEEIVAPGDGEVDRSYPCSLISTSVDGSDRRDDITDDEIEATGWKQEHDLPLRTFFEGSHPPQSGDAILSAATVAEPEAVIDPVLEAELREKVKKGIDVHAEDIRQHLALACAGTGRGLQAAVHEVLQMDDGPARAEAVLKLSTAQKSHVEAALMVIASKIERFRTEAQGHTEDAVKNMRQGRHVGPYILALIDTGASRHVVGEHNPRLAGFLSELDETDRPVFNQIDSNRIQSKGAAPLDVILPSLAADGRTARSASQTKVGLKISVLTGKAAKQMLVLSAGKLMREDSRR